MIGVVDLCSLPQGAVSQGAHASSLLLGHSSAHEGCAANALREGHSLPSEPGPVPPAHRSIASATTGATKKAVPGLRVAA